jgi:hypothetical protein
MAVASSVVHGAFKHQSSIGAPAGLHSSIGTEHHFQTYEASDNYCTFAAPPRFGSDGHIGHRVQHAGKCPIAELAVLVPV